MAYRSMFNSYAMEHPQHGTPNTTYERTGADHSPLFRCTVTYGVAAGTITVVSEWLCPKTAAQENAYQKLLGRLGAIAPLPTSHSAITAPPAPRLLIITSTPFVNGVPPGAAQVVFLPATAEAPEQSQNATWNCFSDHTFDELASRPKPLCIREGDAHELGRFLAWMFGLIEGARGHPQKRYVIHLLLNKEDIHRELLIKRLQQIGIEHRVD